MDADGTFTAWAREHQAGLVRTAFLLCGDHGRAEDLVQEALTRVALRWARLAEENPLGYARQIVYRERISWWRRLRGREVLTATTPEPPSADPSAERRMLVLAALARLSPRQRQVLVMRYFDDLTEKDCARLLGISQGTVKSVAHDAIAALRLKAPELADVWNEV